MYVTLLDLVLNSSVFKDFTDFKTIKTFRDYRGNDTIPFASSVYVTAVERSELFFETRMCILSQVYIENKKKF